METATNETLMASLVAVADEAGLYLDTGEYLDLSAKYGEDGRMLEVGNSDGEAVQICLTRAELVALHSALTRALLAK
jgi:hypothetical protein